MAITQHTIVPKAVNLASAANADFSGMTSAAQSMSQLASSAMQVSDGLYTKIADDYKIMGKRDAQAAVSTDPSTGEPTFHLTQMPDENTVYGGAFTQYAEELMTVDLDLAIQNKQAELESLYPYDENRVTQELVSYSRGIVGDLPDNLQPALTNSANQRIAQLRSKILANKISLQERQQLATSTLAMQKYSEQIEGAYADGSWAQINDKGELEKTEAFIALEQGYEKSFMLTKQNPRADLVSVAKSDFNYRKIQEVAKVVGRYLPSIDDSWASIGAAVEQIELVDWQKLEYNKAPGDLQYIKQTLMNRAQMHLTQETLSDNLEKERLQETYRLNRAELAKTVTDPYEYKQQIAMFPDKYGPKKSKEAGEQLFQHKMAALSIYQDRASNMTKEEAIRELPKIIKEVQDGYRWWLANPNEFNDEFKTFLDGYKKVFNDVQDIKNNKPIVDLMIKNGLMLFTDEELKRVYKAQEWAGQKKIMLDNHNKHVETTRAIEAVRAARDSNIPPTPEDEAKYYSIIGHKLYPISSINDHEAIVNHIDSTGNKIMGKSLEVIKAGLNSRNFSWQNYTALEKIHTGLEKQFNWTRPEVTFAMEAALADDPARQIYNMFFSDFGVTPEDEEEFKKYNEKLRNNLVDEKKRDYASNLFAKKRPEMRQALQAITTNKKFLQHNNYGPMGMLSGTPPKIKKHLNEDDDLKSLNVTDVEGYDWLRGESRAGDRFLVDDVTGIDPAAIDLILNRAEIELYFEPDIENPNAPWNAISRAISFLAADGKLGGVRDPSNGQWRIQSFPPQYFAQFGHQELNAKGEYQQIPGTAFNASKLESFDMNLSFAAMSKPGASQQEIRDLAKRLRIKTNTRTMVERPDGSFANPRYDVEIYENGRYYPFMYDVPFDVNATSRAKAWEKVKALKDPETSSPQDLARALDMPIGNMSWEVANRIAVPSMMVDAFLKKDQRVATMRAQIERHNNTRVNLGFEPVYINDEALYAFDEMDGMPNHLSPIVLQFILTNESTYEVMKDPESVNAFLSTMAGRLFGESDSIDRIKRKEVIDAR